MILVLVRHGQSEWNEKNLFTGWKDPDLTKKGEDEAINAGKMIKKAGITFDVMFTSMLKRAQRTGHYILEEIGQRELKNIRDKALNERDYGDLAGLNKDDARKKWGDEQVHIWRRSYDVPPPGENGESLKDTKDRVMPYYTQHILPRILMGEKILVAAHGNSLRALIMELDGITKEKINELELKTGVPVIYKLNENGSVEEKTILG